MKSSRVKKRVKSDYFNNDTKAKNYYQPSKEELQKRFDSITKILQKMKKLQKINCANIENKNMADMDTEKRK